MSPSLEPPVQRIDQSLVFWGRRLLALIVFTLLLAAARADADMSVKAAYLFNFAKLVEWPQTRFAQADTPIRIAVVDQASTAAASIMRLLEGKRVGARTVVVEHVTVPSAALDEVHLVFRADATPLPPELIERLRRSGVLIVDGYNGLGTIQFREVDESVKFEINLAEAQRSGLRLSARLASVAWRIRRSDP